MMLTQNPFGVEFNWYDHPPLVVSLWDSNQDSPMWVDLESKSNQNSTQPRFIIPICVTTKLRPKTNQQLTTVVLPQWVLTNKEIQTQPYSTNHFHDLSRHLGFDYEFSSSHTKQQQQQQQQQKIQGNLQHRFPYYNHF